MVITFFLRKALSFFKRYSLTGYGSPGYIIPTLVMTVRGFPDKDLVKGARFGGIFDTLIETPILSRFPGSYPAWFSQPSSGTGFSLNYRISGVVIHQRPCSVHLP
jgi:hypothetical protein